MVDNAGLSEHFDHLLAADLVERYKPAPAIYGLAADARGRDPSWVLGIEPDLVIQAIGDLA